MLLPSCTTINPFLSTQLTTQLCRRRSGRLESERVSGSDDMMVSV